MKNILIAKEKKMLEFLPAILSFFHFWISILSADVKAEETLQLG